jgi:PKD repeat protein
LIGAYNNSSGTTPPLSGYFLNGAIAEIIFYDTILNDSLRNLIEIYLRNKYAPPVNLGYDIRVPYGFCDTAITTAYKPWYVAYQWSTGETDSIIHVNKPGVYSVTVTDIFGFESSDDIRVYYPAVNQLSDTVVCYGQSITWDLGLTGTYFYEWIGLPETSHTVVIENQGEYAAILTDSLGCKFYTDTISLNFDYYELTASVGPADTLLCSGNRLMLVTNRDETVNYLWNTGSQEPEIVLTESGTYSVTVTNQRGCIAIDEINVTITGTVPVPDFSYSGQCKSNPMLLNDLSQSEQGNIISWEWKINDEIFSTEENPILPGTYLSSNNLENSQYYIELTVLTDAGCSDFTGKLIDVYALPKAEYAADFLCQHSETRFRSLSQVQNANIIQNIWSIENLNLEGDEVFTSFTESGWKNIKLISTSDKNCKDSIIGKVFIKEAELPVFEWQNACAGEPVYFINRTPVNIVNMPERYLWNFGDGNTAESSSPVNIYNEAGTKTVSLEITYQNRCTARSETEISIYENPEISLSEFHSCVNKNFIPQVEIISNDGEIQSYLWNLSHDGYTILTSSLAQPEFMIQDTGQYLLKLTVKTENQCKAEATSNLTVHKNPEVSMLISDIWGAVPLSVDIIGIGEDVNDFEWKIGEEILYGQELNYVFTEAGTYNIILTGISEYGCTNQDLKMVKVVIPIMDIQLYNLNLKVENNYLKTSVYVINSGTLPCENAPIILNLGEARIFREIIPYLAPSKVLKYDFSMQVYVPDGEVPDPVCVEIEVHPYFGFADINPENNILCHTETESLKVFAPYPNPAKDVLICEYINILSSSTKFELFNNVGERVYIQEFNSPSIYNKVELNVSEFFSGIYYLKVSNEQNYKYFKVVVG